MDIQKDPKKSSFISKKSRVFLVIILAFFSLLLLMNNAMNTAELSKRELLFSTVLQGSLDNEIDGFGVLKSEKLQLITAVTRATVKNIRLKPGAKVNTNSILSN